VTTLSLLPGPLKRLFAKIDAAATGDRSLELALDHWRIKRGDRLLPRLADMDMKQLGPLASQLFLFESCDEDDWVLRLQDFPPSAIDVLRSACGTCSSS
jgi:hypothetical protein